MDSKLKKLRKKLGLRQEEMANMLYIKQNAYSNIENGKTSLTDKNAQILSDKLGIDKNWLLDNKNLDESLKEIGHSYSENIDDILDKQLDFFIKKARKDVIGTTQDAVSQNVVPYKETPYPVKPFIDSVYAVCGTPSGFSIAIKETECEGLSLPFMNEYDFSIKAKGDSMVNRSNPARSIREGDIVACRLWKSRSHVRWGEVYALATSEGVIIKKLQESEKEGQIKCVSFNIEDGFTPYDLPVEEIFDWAIVTGVVSARNWN